MFALPRQTLAQWRDTLDQALALETDHLSLYSLIVEDGTGFYTLQQKGRLPLPDEDLAAEMFQMAIDAAAGAGLRPVRDLQLRPSGPRVPPQPALLAQRTLLRLRLRRRRLPKRRAPHERQIPGQVRRGGRNGRRPDRSPPKRSPAKKPWPKP